MGTVLPADPSKLVNTIVCKVQLQKAEMDCMQVRKRVSTLLML